MRRAGVFRFQRVRDDALSPADEQARAAGWITSAVTRDDARRSMLLLTRPQISLAISASYAGARRHISRENYNAFYHQLRAARPA